MPLQETSGNLTTDAFGGGVAVVPKYIEDYFSTFLYTGNNTARSIINGIDLSTKGGLTWIKERTNASGHSLFDTVRGAGFQLSSNSTAQQYNNGVQTLTSFNTDGFSLGTDTDGYGVNRSNNTYASWSWAKAPKFFDIVTYTGNNVDGRSISHNLGSEPGFIIVKRTDSTGDWKIYHRSGPVQMCLNLTAIPGATAYANGYVSTPTSTTFDVNAYGGSITAVNATGGTYVAYLFAHNAGGFGLTGTDNVISCGSFTRTFGTANSVNLGYEPQWVLIKCTTQTDSWQLYDTMRGLSQTASLKLEPNSSNSESDTAGMIPTATGFDITATGVGGGTFIYIAIRRGPMKVPTDATKVFSPLTRTGTGATVSVTGVGFSPDLIINGNRNSTNGGRLSDRLRGVPNQLLTYDTVAEQLFGITTIDMDGITIGTNANWNTNTNTYINWYFRRAPSFFDEVCYTGNDTGTRVLDHNLAVFPELVIVKKRSAALGWAVQASTFTADNILFLNTTAALTSTASYLSYPEQNTSTTFKVRYNLNVASDTYVAYLFATCAGVSKVGSYTGNGTTQTINCGFTGGARFVLIKRTDSTGDWYIYDTARGMTTLTDPYLLLNSTAAEVATLGSVTTVSTGFALNATILAAINTNSATYIFLAIA